MLIMGLAANKIVNFKKLNLFLKDIDNGCHWTGLPISYNEDLT
jgi:hypothetical protein